MSNLLYALKAARKDVQRIMKDPLGLALWIVMP
ncbi:unnamed protein product, partial [marine sediment metagenome]